MIIVKLKYYRHATFILTINNVRILVDPMYMQKGTLPPIPSTFNLHWNPLEKFPEEYPKMTDEDILLITHHHFDHFDKIAAQNLPKSITVISPVNGQRKLRRLGFQNIYPVNSGHELTVHGLGISATPAKDTQYFSKMLCKPGVGYLIQYLSKTIYISGDTVYFGKLISTLKNTFLDMAILYGGGAKIPIVGRHTFSHKEVLLITEKLNPQNVVVVHLDSLNHCKENRNDLKKLVGTLKLQSKLVLPLPGEEHVFKFA
jgi:L-ascorbate metabolism protein UlaG (beta-lactamase superfamily)